MTFQTLALIQYFSMHERACMDRRASVRTRPNETPSAVCMNEVYLRPGAANVIAVLCNKKAKKHKCTRQKHFKGQRGRPSRRPEHRSVRVPPHVSTLMPRRAVAWQDRAVSK